MPHMPNANYLADEQLEEMLQDMIDRSSALSVLLALGEVLREHAYHEEAELVEKAANL